MAFVVGVFAAGGVIAFNHDNHSRYREHSHRNYREYGDSELREQIRRKEEEVRRKDSDVETLRRRMNESFNERINRLKYEKNYSGLNCSPNVMVREVKDDMRRELDNEISRDKQELSDIDKMIARINELELQSKR